MALVCDATTQTERLSALGQGVGEPTEPPAIAPLENAAVTAAATIAIVDDEPINIKLVRKHLSIAGYRQFIAHTRPAEGLAAIFAQKPDVLLLDIMMPEMSGLEVLQRLRGQAETQLLPIIILTAADDDQTKLQALELGATEFLGKPVRAVELIPRVRNALLVKAHHDHLRDYAQTLERRVRERTEELIASRVQLIHCLARAAEFRDKDTGRHVIRVGRYVGVIARQLGLDSDTCELYEHAAPLHDMGKIGVPDSVLLKPGRLTPEEFEHMQRHTQLGKKTFEPLQFDERSSYENHTLLGVRILEEGRSLLLALAGSIALTHHERWDGKGYPLGLSGEQIPLEGRITAVADVFDALSSRRPYKPAMSLEQCLQAIADGRGSHFDPAVVDAFFAAQAEIIRLRVELADVD